MHALEKLWKAYVFHAEGSREADFRVFDRTLRMLFGEVGQMVIGHSSHHHQTARFAVALGPHLPRHGHCARSERDPAAAGEGGVRGACAGGSP